jgi:hypothetical protein
MYIGHWVSAVDILLFARNITGMSSTVARLCDTLIISVFMYNFLCEVGNWLCLTCTRSLN